MFSRDKSKCTWEWSLALALAQLVNLGVNPNPQPSTQLPPTFQTPFNTIRKKNPYGWWVGCRWVGGWQVGWGFFQQIISISGFISQAGTCKIFSLDENRRWSWVWQQQKIKWTIKLETSKPQVMVFLPPPPLVELCIINHITYSNNILSSHLYNIDAFLGFLL